MKIQAGIKLLSEIEGYGNPIQDSDRFDAVLKFYRNKGDPLEFDTVLQEPIPYIVTKMESQQLPGMRRRCTDRMSFMNGIESWRGRPISFLAFTTRFWG
jgi:hypothetical protein